jgi:hypothetical protein
LSGNVGGEVIDSSFDFFQKNRFIEAEWHFGILCRYRDREGCRTGNGAYKYAHHLCPPNPGLDMLLHARTKAYAEGIEWPDRF